MKCLCIRTEGPGRRLICNRTSVHADQFGSIEEGHHWVLATDEQWAQRLEDIHQAWAGRPVTPPPAEEDAAVPGQ
jgi:hypothetical protein